jgi:hypothetical protein
MERNICFVISVMNYCDRSGGIPYFQIKGEGSNHYTDFNIANHVSREWNESMINELREGYNTAKGIRNEMVSFFLVCFYIILLYY